MGDDVRSERLREKWETTREVGDYTRSWRLRERLEIARESADWINELEDRTSALEDLTN